MTTPRKPSTPRKPVDTKGGVAFVVKGDMLEARIPRGDKILLPLTLTWGPYNRLVRLAARVCGPDGDPRMAAAEMIDAIPEFLFEALEDLSQQQGNAVLETWIKHAMEFNSDAEGEESAS